jgi:AcrR family transcriptional regulator
MGGFYMPQNDETRGKLLEATLELISEKGYLGATTREISALAGVSELTLFRKFGKKEHLFEEMLENYTFLPRLRDLLDEIGEMHVEEGLKTIGVRFLQSRTFNSAAPLSAFSFPRSPTILR